MPRMDHRPGAICARPDNLIVISERSVLKVPAFMCDNMTGDDIIGEIIDMDPDGVHWISTSFGLYALTQHDLALDVIEVVG